MVTLTYHVIDRIHVAWGPWHFRDFSKTFLPNIGEDQEKKVLPSESGATDTVPYGKSAPGYCITFIKRSAENLK